ncbi:diphthine--ammonia ligase [Aridibaculum aurantiacum]|uniref:Dph6-related ATP pyrophosphatase n=1 Tax=Aridibaculum aurantiacum TaxID=2810307 RepID=UPI001A968924|nr:diphthine--ammonia ligase [Aridibaculum aurantiacum]
MHNRFVVSWSGGKDSCFATILAIEQGLQPAVLVNVLNEEGQISRSHGIPIAILKKQAEAIGLPLHLVSSSWSDYQPNFINALTYLKNEYKLDHAVFGDIDLQAHRDWEEMVCQQAGLSARLPLWKMERKALVLQMLEGGLETMIVSCNKTMGEAYLGKILTPQLVQELEEKGIDPCGENGEFHTLVTNCSLFKSPIQVIVTGTQQHNDYWFASLQ